MNQRRTPIRRAIPFAGALIILTLCATPLTASGSAERNRPIRVSAIAGPSGLGMAGLLKSPPIIGGQPISVEIAASVDALVPKIAKGELDVAILPPNVAAKLYTRGNRSIVACAVVGNATLSVVTTDRALRTLSDLRGKTLVIAGQGSTPEYVIRALLERAGIGQEDIILDFSFPTPEIPAALASGRVAYALLPEPFATVAVESTRGTAREARRAIVIRDEWKRAGFGDDFPMTLCVASRSFAEKRPAELRAFLAAYKSSIEWAVSSPVEAAKAAEAGGVGVRAALGARAIPESALVFVPAREARAEIETLLSVFLARAPNSIGGVLPDGDFYLP